MYRLLKGFYLRINIKFTHILNIPHREWDTKKTMKNFNKTFMSLFLEFIVSNHF